ncbi:MAG: hypothetical protein AYK19_17975 [Theionarchaea archaeon DG-70-1]|nr:MAG: hypothetical protein AYK19_17975 [Theionarchaea archaeon DG-70-1]
MATTGMIQLASHAASVIACAVLAAYFLRAFLNKRLRTSLWWAAGFSLFAIGIVVMTGGVLYGFRTIFVMLAFAVVAASVAFFYYAASLHFLDRKSFFREKFTVILFVVSFVLFVLPVYFLSEEYMSRIVESQVIVLFVFAFLVLAVLFNQFVERLSKKYCCKRRGALQSLAWWMISFGSLCVALFYGSVVMVGLVLVLSVCGFVLLLYGCNGGVNMKVAFIEEDKELNK